MISVSNKGPQIAAMSQIMLNDAAGGIRMVQPFWQLFKNLSPHQVASTLSACCHAPCQDDSGLNL